MNDSLDKSEQLFVAESWVRNKLPDASSLKTETLKTVEGFVLLWNIFEGSMCNANANIEKFQNIAQNLTNSQVVEKSVNKSLSFYRDRYVEKQEIKQLFYGLNFRSGDMKEHVESVLKGEKTKLYDKILALLIIAYRIRNNIFHGLKSASKWNKQTENISEASRILSFIIESGIAQRTVKW